MNEKSLYTLTIDPEFRDLIPPLNEEELAMLDGWMKVLCRNDECVSNEESVSSNGAGSFPVSRFERYGDEP